MASKERPTLHLKKNPDFPPGPPGPPEGPFDPADAMRRANETLDEMKRSVYAAGSNPAKISAEWSKARDTHDAIVRSVQEYRATNDVEERALLAQQIKEKLAYLQGDVEEDVRAAYQETNKVSEEESKSISPEMEKARAQQHREKAREENIVADRIVNRVTKVMNKEAYAHKQRQKADIEEEIKEKRAHLDKLNEIEKHTSWRHDEREKDFLETEDEIRYLENQLRDLTHRETKQKLEEMVKGATAEQPKTKRKAETSPETEQESDVQSGAVVRTQKPTKRTSGAAGSADDEIIDAEFEDINPLNPNEPILLPDLRADRVFVPQNEIEALALETRGADAMHLFRNRAESRITTGERSETDRDYALQMFAAEKDYLDAYKKMKSTQGFGATLADKFVDADAMMPKSIKAKRERWLKKRGEYLRNANASLENRLTGKQEAKARDGKTFDREALKARYERRYSKDFLEAAVFGAEKAEQDARAAGLEAREKKTVERLFERYQKTPAYVRIPATFAAVTAASAAVTGGATIGLGALAFATTATGIRSALSYAIERTDNEALKKTLSGISQYTNIGAIGNLLGAWTTRKVHEGLGTEAHAEKTLAKEHTLSDFNTNRHLSGNSILHQRDAALKSKENVERQARLAGAATGTVAAVGLGGLIGNFFHGLFGGNNHVEVPPTPNNEPVFPTPGAPFATHSEGFQTPTADEVSHAQILHGESASHAVAAHQVHEGAAHHHHAEHAATPHVAREHISEDDTKLIMGWEKQYGGLPPHADAHIHDVIARLHENSGPDTFKDVQYDATPETVPAGEPMSVQEIHQEALPETVPPQDVSGIHEAPHHIYSSEVIHTVHGVEVHPNETHVYAAVDNATGVESKIIFGGGTLHDKGYLDKMISLAKEVPNQKVYFDPGEPTMVNGYPQPWIQAAYYDPVSGIHIEALPEPGLVGAKINPEVFTKLIK